MNKVIRLRTQRQREKAKMKKYVMQLTMGPIQANFRFEFEGSLAEAASHIHEESANGSIRLTDYDDGTVAFVLLPTAMGYIMRVIDGETFERAMKDARYEQMRQQGQQGPGGIVQ